VKRSEPQREQSEQRFLATYRPEKYPRPAVTVDIVILTIVDADAKVLLVKRKEHPCKDQWALPGGFVRVADGPRDSRGVKDQGEDLEAAAERELAEETSLPRGSAYLEQLAAFGRAGRDPRMRVISVAYYALVRPTLVPLVRGGGDASDAKWFSVSELDRASLAFDHGDMLTAALTRARTRIDESSIAFELVPETFTIPELRAVYEVIKGAPQDAGNFRKRFFRMMDDGVLEPAPGKRVTASKPAKVYRFRRAAASAPRPR
jgi:8-oxo-dGTP diphosphatase